MKRLALFFALTYALTWVCFITVAARPMPPLLGQTLALAGASAPALAAIALTAHHDGAPGVRVLLRPAVRWRVPVFYYIFALFFIAVVKLIVAVLIRLSTAAWPAFGNHPLPLMLVATLISTPFQAGEEIGWRGLALPQLARHFGLAPASLVLGVIWACWHLPQFYIRQADTWRQSFPMYFLQVVAISVAMAWLWARTHQSLLLPMLFHAANNNFKDIVPSALPQPLGVFTFHASLVGWLTVAFLWAAAAVFLATMPKITRESANTDCPRNRPLPESS